MTSSNNSQLVRWASSVGGGVLAAVGLRQRSVLGALVATAGGGLVYWSTRGTQPEAGSAGSSREASASAERSNMAATSGLDVQQIVTIDKPRSELYAFWHSFENLPHFMKHLESVTVLDNRRSHWVAKAPAGATVEWDAEITDERPDELIAWRALPGADVENVGTVRFEDAPGGRGTVVCVSIKYKPPVGLLGAAVAKLWGEEPNQQVKEDLRRFKNLMEAGEIPTTQGQPSGTRSPLGKLLSPNS